MSNVTPPLIYKKEPVRFFVILLTGIFLTELFIMVIISGFGLNFEWLLHFADALLLAGLVSPIIYFFSFRPLMKQVKETQRFNKMLEQKMVELQRITDSERGYRQFAEGLAQLSIAINASLDLQDVLEHILESMHTVENFRAAFIMLSTDQGLEVAHRWGIEISAYLNTVSKETSPCFKYIQEHQLPYVLPDTIENTEKIPFFLQDDQFSWIRSFAALPMVVGEELVGVVVLLSDRPGFFGDEVLKRVSAFAAPAAVAVQNARLYQAESEARHIAELLSSATAELTQWLSLEKRVEILLHYLYQITRFDSAEILLKSDEGRSEVFAIDVAHPDINIRKVGNLEVDLQEYPHLKSVMQTGKSVIIDDPFARPEWKSIIDSPEVRSLLSVPVMVSKDAIGVISLKSEMPARYSSKNLDLAEVLVKQASVAIQNGWLFDQVRAGRERQQSLSRRLVEVQENERRYLARELHDEVSQALVSIKLGLQRLEKEAVNRKGVTSITHDLMVTTNSLLENMHRLAMDLRPASLDHLGLIVALQNFFQVLNERSIVNFRFKVWGLGEQERLNPEVETTLFRIAQEAATNICRHSKATRTDVLLERRGESIVLIIEDDGTGFDIVSTGKGTQLGLLGMQERAEMVGGKLYIESSSDVGTTIVVEVPYAHSFVDR